MQQTADRLKYSGLKDLVQRDCIKNERFECYRNPRGKISIEHQLKLHLETRNRSTMKSRNDIKTRRKLSNNYNLKKIN